MTRRNQRSKPPLPEGWELLAVAYGTGPDDYLATVLAFQDNGREADKYVTWIWNSDTGCQGVGEGHYFDQWSYPNPEELAEAAWAEFVKRSTPIILKAHRWRPKTLAQVFAAEEEK